MTLGYVRVTAALSRVESENTSDSDNEKRVAHALAPAHTV
jgi:hypothetical protein